MMIKVNKMMFCDGLKCWKCTLSLSIWIFWCSVMVSDQCRRCKDVWIRRLVSLCRLINVAHVLKKDEYFALQPRTMFVPVSHCTHDLQSLLWPAGGDDTGQKLHRTVGTTNLLTWQNDYGLINSVEHCFYSVLLLPAAILDHKQDEIQTTGHVCSRKHVCSI